MRPLNCLLTGALAVTVTDVQHKEDSVTPEGTGTVLRVKSPSGIGYATITPNKGHWPEQVTVLLDGFGELESSQVKVGRISAYGSRKSSRGFTLVLLDKDKRSEAGTLDIKVEKRKDGIAVVFPAQLFVETDAVTVEWINLLRR